MEPIEREPWWADRVAFIKSRPTDEGLRRLARVVSRGSSVVRVRRIGGGLATATSEVTMRTSRGANLAIILKRFPRTNDPHIANEWDRLHFAERIPVPTPEPIAFDPYGEWFRCPALAMSKLPGRPDVNPYDLRRWIAEFADVQVAIHSTPKKGLSPRDVVAQPIKDPPSSGAIEAAMRYVGRRFARARTRDLVVGHGDPHPGNVLWRRRRISGVTDWSHAGVYPRGHEVAYTRADIAVLAGLRAADLYLETYERTSGTRVGDLAMWDLRQAVAAIRWSHLWAIAYREQGSKLMDRTANRRAVAFLENALRSGR